MLILQQAYILYLYTIGIRPNTQSFVSKCKSNEDKLQHTTRTNTKYICLYICCLDILFSSNHNIHNSSCDLCFWASDQLIDKFYKNLSIKGSEAQKQRSHELL